MITKSQVIEHFGSVAAVAEFFKLSVQAVYLWDEQIPPLREAQLMLAFPAKFGKKREAA